MTPYFTTNYTANVTSGNIELSRQFIHVVNSIFIKISNFKNLFFGKFSVFRNNSFLKISFPAFFSCHIHNVICLCPEPEMFNSTARWSITPVQNAHSFWDWAIKQFPRNPMGCFFFMVFSWILDESISTRLFWTYPKPARISFLYMIQKLSDYFFRNGIDKIFSHRDVPPGVVPPVDEVNAEVIYRPNTTIFRGANHVS